MTELSIAMKATFILILGLSATAITRRARASRRHLVLAATFCGLLALLPLLMLLPELTIVLPVPMQAPLVDSAITDQPSTQSTMNSVNGVRTAIENEIQSLTFSSVLRISWVIVMALVLTSAAIDLFRLGRMRQSGLPWPERNQFVRALAQQTGIWRRVEVLVHSGIEAPLTCGIWRPAILLPIAAYDWHESDIRRALVHELEHVRRYDWAVHLVARAACAIYWFHPLAWMAWRKLCLEAERACDDAVLQSSEQTEYAHQLVQLARQISKADTPALAMANRSDLSARVSAILDKTRQRGRPGAVPVIAVIALAAVLVLAVAPAVLTATQAVEQRRSSILDRALVEAADNGDLEDILELLNAGANVDAVVRGDGSPLIAAARSGEKAAVLLLLDRGADPNMPVSGDGNPLIAAAAEGHLDIVELLLNRGAIIDQGVPGDENALIQASAEGHLNVVKLLVARGADVNFRVWVDDLLYGGRSEWRTPLSMARQGRHNAVIEYLISVGARY